LLTSLLGAGLFAWCASYLYFRFEWRPVLAIVARANLLWLVVGGGLAIIGQFALRTLRWRMLLRAADRDLRFVDLYFITAVSLSLTVMTPAQSGEALKVELLKRRGVLDRLPGYGTFLVERATDLLVVVLMAALSVAFGPTLVAGQSRLTVALPAAAAALLAGLVAFGRLRARGVVGAWLARLRGASGDSSTLAAVFGLTVASWLVVAVGWQMCLFSIGLRITIAEVIALTSIVTLVNVLTFLPGGLGINEVFFPEVLERLGYATPLAQAGAVIIRCQWLLMISIGLAHLLAWRLVVPAAAADARGA
jgi:uncharacterized membrane protein YbhN (UPF0104 family)